MRPLNTRNTPLTRATHRPLKDIMMTTKIDVPKLSPTPIEGDPFTMTGVTPEPVEETPARSRIDFISWILGNVLTAITAITIGVALGVAAAWYLTGVGPCGQ